MDLTGFGPYVTAIEDLASRRLRGGTEHGDDAKTAAVLNGGPSRALRRSVSLKDRQASGAFFTGHDLGQHIVDRGAISIESRYLDPACGTGDLLLHSAAHLPVAKNLEGTLHLWGERLFGTDLHSEFIRVARARLILYAIERSEGDYRTMKPLDDYFPNLECGDALAEVRPVDSDTHILLNPPYTKVAAPEACDWATGLTSSAAFFCETYLRAAEPGTKLWAILPDVLRTGTRYQGWRSHLESLAAVDDVLVWGEFDSAADVDVFILRATAAIDPQNPPTAWWRHENSAAGQLGDHFAVSVGPVVPHRHADDLGPEYPFLHAKNAAAWTEIGTIHERRRFAGRVIEPPFVVIRRTSSPSDRHRAVASVIAGNEQVAVENHLIVLQPFDRKVETCRYALEQLRLPEIDAWLNERIRCRHLTVSSVRELPWPSIDE